MLGHGEPRLCDARAARQSEFGLLEPDDLHVWNGGRRIVPVTCPGIRPDGHCGSPIEIEEGWLVPTHGVGTVRNYCIGARLLDRDDPSRMLARMTLPLGHPSSRERHGYGPNVVDSCEAMVRDRTLLPYGVAEDFATFATVGLDELLAAMS